MSGQSPSSSFEAAALYLSTASSLATVSTAIKLELYGLFKCIKVSPTPTTPRPSIFDMTGRAKWDAWISVGKAYPRREDAQHKYLELARSLGWTEGATVDPKIAIEHPEDDIWDDTQSTSGGMGGAVSTMIPPLEEADDSVHGFAIRNNISGLSTLLDQHPNTNLNEPDEFGYTPLHLACDRGNLPVVQLLVHKGVDTTIKDPDGLSALDLAQIAGHDEIQEYLQSLK